MAYMVCKLVASRCGLMWSNSTHHAWKAFLIVNGQEVVAVWLDLALFPGLHAQLLSLVVRKAGEDLDGFIT